jgi:hypothetical protein
MLQFVKRSRRSNLLPAEDLLSVGLVGLRRAAARYDPARKTRFSTVATVWVLQVRGGAGVQLTLGVWYAEASMTVGIDA